MILPPKTTHPEGDKEIAFPKREISALVADTFDGVRRLKRPPWDSFPFSFYFLFN
jgi:hypothetical protein